ncbi:MAG: hypothetical protein MPN21_06745 [Thermoanaerobaculia bacterium]|nr:hypothetical protein [Thermoanaerobaculia bacterium]
MAAKKVRLAAIAHARSGDKGDGSNVGLIADRAEFYPILLEEVTEERVKEHFRGFVHGRVERFEVANLKALNFLLHDSLGGGGTESLKIDAQGKTHGQGLLQMEVQIPEELLGLVRDRR